jgi:hypothetical protein
VLHKEDALSAYNVLIYQQGGTLYLDEALPAQPSAATISVTALDARGMALVDGSFSDITDAACTLDNLVLTLPAKTPPWKVVVPTATAGTIGDMAGEGRKFLLNRGGRKQWMRVSEFDTSGATVTEVRFDEGIDFALKAGDTLKGVRVSYNVDWSGSSSTFTGQVKVTWKVTVNGVVQPFVRIYDVVKQVLDQPATWADVLDLRSDADDQLSQVPNKERFVAQAWRDVVRDLYSMGIRHNLIIPDGNTVLKDVTVLQCLRNLVMFQGLSIPDGYIGQADDYIETLATSRAAYLGSLKIAMDQDEDGSISASELMAPKRQAWFRRNRVRDLGGSE